MIVKERTDTGNWHVYHKAASSDPETDYLWLNTTIALTDNDNVWNDTAPTASDFTVGGGNDVNNNGKDHVAYLWAEVPGFSRFGSYTGNGNSDGPFVWCGFRPALVIMRRTNNTGAWVMFDNARDPYNLCTSRLRANASDAVDTFNEIDMLSNGFKLRSTDGFNNANGGSYVFMAFAEHPFKYSNAR
jgi:hypothetical protein